MIVLKTLLSFRDNLEKKQRLFGEIFEVTEERFNKIIEALPGYVEIVEITEVNYFEIIEPIEVKENFEVKTRKPRTKKI